MSYDRELWGLEAWGAWGFGGLFRGVFSGLCYVGMAQCILLRHRAGCLRRVGCCSVDAFLSKVRSTRRKAGFGSLSSKILVRP